MAKNTKNDNDAFVNDTSEAEAKAEAEAEAKAKAEAEAKAKAEKETVFIPKTRANSRGRFIGINGETWRVPTGKYVEVPKCVAKVIRQSEKAKAAIIEDKIAHSE